MTYYNTTLTNESLDIYGIFKLVGSEPTGGLFWAVILLVIWVISFMALKQYSTSRAWTFASFFCSILSIFLVLMEYLAPKWMYFVIILTLIGFVWLKLEED